MIRFLLIPTCFACIFLAFTPRAYAQAVACTVDMDDIAFGTISVRAGVSNETSGQLTIDCAGVGTIGICVRFGAGSGGAGGGLSPRYMLRADSAQLAFELRPDGNGSANGTWVEEYVELVTNLGSGSLSIPVFADITANSVSVGIGTYSSNFSGFASIEENVTSCADSGIVVAIPEFTITANVSASCEVDAAALDFGVLGPATTGAVDAASSIFVRCTQSTPYSIRLDNGMGTGASGPTDRRLTSGANQLRYGLYQDAARSTPWGNLASNDVSSTGNGNDQSFALFGRIFDGQSMIAGSYSDTVIITIEY